MDRGFNGNTSGNDGRLIAKNPHRTVEIRGVDNHEKKSAPLETAGGVTLTKSGEAILIMNQCRCHGKNKTIHSSPQIEFCKNKVDDRSMKVDGG